MSARPGANSRGRGTKRKGFKRGGGRNFSRIEFEEPKDALLNEDEDGSEESGSEASSESDGAGPSYVQEEHPGPQLGMTREEARAAKKAKKEAAKQKVAQRAVQVGDLPPSDSEDSDGGGEPARAPAPSNPNKKGGILKNAKTPAAAGSSSSDSGSEDDSDDSDDDEGKLASGMKKVALSKKAVADKTTEEEREIAERLLKIREERAQKEQFLQAEREEVEEKNKARKEKTEALLKKAMENKLGGKKKGKGKGKK